MNNEAISESKPGAEPPITAAEFDAKFDAGEDVSVYVDRDNAVMVEPGELSPGQKLSLIETMIGELMEQQKGPSPAAVELASLSISIPRILLSRVSSAAARQRVSRDELLGAWIEAKLLEEPASK